MNRNKQLSINLVASILAFIINMGINFFLTPYITKNIGVEAYGFVSLGMQFINYASLVTIALNSMAGRFITIEIHRENWEAANKYFNSVLLSNVIVAGLLLIPSILVVAFLDKIVNIPVELLSDVKLLFAFLFLNYLISIVVSSFGVSTFATNKLYLKSLRKIESRVLKAALLIFLFVLLEPAVFYVGFTAVAVVLYVAFFNIFYTRKFLPKIKINKVYFDIKVVFELISSGIWNMITRLSQILSSGLDLLIANIFIDATAMGILSLAKIIPTMISSLISTIAGVFMPELTIYFAKEQNEEFLKSLRGSMKLLGIISVIPLAGLVSFGNEFFTLWVPEQDAIILHILSTITTATLIVSGSINSINNIFTVTNKLRVNSLVLLVNGILNVVLVFILLKTTNLGIFAIASVSTFTGILRNLLFIVPYGAKCLNLKFTTFYKEVGISVGAFLIITSFGFLICSLWKIDNWLKLIISSIFLGFLGLLISVYIFLNKEEREYFKKILENRLKRR